MSTRTILAVVSLFAVSGFAQADSFDININETVLRAVYGSDVGTGGEFEIGYLYSEDNDDLAHLGFNVSGQNWSEEGTFSISLGGRAVGFTSKAADMAAIALGGRIRFSPVHRFGITGLVYYAPSVATFIDGEHYYEAAARLDYQLLPQAFIYLGYRLIEVDVEGADDWITIDDSAQVGMKLLF